MPLLGAVTLWRFLLYLLLTVVFSRELVDDHLRKHFLLSGFKLEERGIGGENVPFDRTGSCTV